MKRVRKREGIGTGQRKMDKILFRFVVLPWGATKKNIFQVHMMANENAGFHKSAAQRRRKVLGEDWIRRFLTEKQIQTEKERERNE